PSLTVKLTPRSASTTCTAPSTRSVKRLDTSTRLTSPMACCPRPFPSHGIWEGCCQSRIALVRRGPYQWAPFLAGALMNVPTKQAPDGKSAQRSPQIMVNGGTAAVHLPLAVCDYDHTRDLASGAVRAEGIAITPLIFDTIEEITFRFLKNLEWDV